MLRQPKGVQALVSMQLVLKDNKHWINGMSLVWLIVVLLQHVQLLVHVVISDLAQVFVTVLVVFNGLQYVNTFSLIYCL